MRSSRTQKRRPRTSEVAIGRRPQNRLWHFGNAHRADYISSKPAVGVEKSADATADARRAGPKTVAWHNLGLRCRRSDQDRMGRRPRPVWIIEKAVAGGISKSRGCSGKCSGHRADHNRYSKSRSGKSRSGKFKSHGQTVSTIAFVSRASWWNVTVSL